MVVVDTRWRVQLETHALDLRIDLVGARRLGAETYANFGWTHVRLFGLQLAVA